MGEIMNDYETGDGRTSVGRYGRPLHGTFPKSWGEPPFDLEERRTWISHNIELGQQRLDRGEKAEGQKVRTWRQALAALRLKQGSPAEVNHVRMRLLELLGKGPL